MECVLCELCQFSGLLHVLCGLITKYHGNLSTEFDTHPKEIQVLVNFAISRLVEVLGLLNTRAAFSVLLLSK
eukprot:4011924-Amphidinium_carterae.1